MGHAWITLAQRKGDLISATNNLTKADAGYSMDKRTTQRHLATEQSIFNSDKTKELRSIKSELDKARNNRPNSDSSEYDSWKETYAEAKEKYEAKKEDILDYYDGLETDAETEATDEETFIQEQMSTIEAQLNAMNSEIESITEEIKEGAQNSAPQFS